MTILSYLVGYATLGTDKKKMMMNMHWGKTLSRKRNKISHTKTENYSAAVIVGGFPYNATQYKHSEEKLLWDKIWDEAMNHSLANRNSTYMQNVYMQKTRLLEDMMGAHGKVHPHSFAMVMVIASMFLFFTLAILIAVIVFCRKKNVVFALQKSEQEDEGEYELDDMDTNTDCASEDDDVESGSVSSSPRKRRQNGQYLSVSSEPDSSIGDNKEELLHKMAQISSPIYKPKRIVQQVPCDSRGAYQPINVLTTNTTAVAPASQQQDMCCGVYSSVGGGGSTDSLIYSSISNIPDSPFATATERKRKTAQSLLCVKKNKSGGVISCVDGDSGNASNLVVVADNESMVVDSKCCNGLAIPAMAITSCGDTSDQRQFLHSQDNQCGCCSNNGHNNVIFTGHNKMDVAQCKLHRINHKSPSIKSTMTATNDSERTKQEKPIQDYNAVENCQLSAEVNCNKYDTEISLVGNNADKTNTPSMLYCGDIAIVRLMEKNGAGDTAKKEGSNSKKIMLTNNETQTRNQGDREPLISPVSSVELKGYNTKDSETSSGKRTPAHQRTRPCSSSITIKCSSDDDAAVCYNEDDRAAYSDSNNLRLPITLTNNNNDMHKIVTRVKVAATAHTNSYHPQYLDSDKNELGVRDEGLGSTKMTLMQNGNYSSSEDIQSLPTETGADMCDKEGQSDSPSRLRRQWVKFDDTFH